MEQTTNIRTNYLCHCLRITPKDFEGMLDATPCPSFEKLKQAHGIGSLCSSCEYEAKGVVQEYVMLNPLGNQSSAEPVKSPVIKKEKPKKPAKPLSLRKRIKNRLKEWFLGAPPSSATSKAVESVKEKKVKPKEEIAPAAPKMKDYLTGVFFMRGSGLETHLVISNLGFPESSENANGEQVTFIATLHGQDGTLLGVSSLMSVGDEQSREFTPQELFPEVKGDFVGGIYVDFQGIAQTGSLRPYGVLVGVDPSIRARCHFHDKFALFRDPGYFQNTSPFEPGQTCWMAVANCQPQAYNSTVHLKTKETQFQTQIDLAPMAATWVKLEDLFPETQSMTPSALSPALFWLENPQHIMVYFFWHNVDFNSWMGQHH
jgi:bacterioferritin-associated ferredoxin